MNNHMPPQIPDPFTATAPIETCKWYSPLCKVTTTSKVLAAVMFIILPFVGGYIGYKVASDQINIVREGSVEPVSGSEVEQQKIQPVLSGTCEPGLSLLPKDLYSSIEKSIGIQNQSYIMDSERPYPSRAPGVGRIYPNARFNCMLSDGTFIASFVYDDKNEREPPSRFIPPSRFKVAHFNAKGEILSISPQNKGESVGGQFTAQGVSNNILRFTSKVVDPCYEMLHKYIYNLQTGEYTETSEGGNDAKCWEELNARGGV